MPHSVGTDETGAIPFSFFHFSPSSVSLSLTFCHSPHCPHFCKKTGGKRKKETKRQKDKKERKKKRREIQAVRLDSISPSAGPSRSGPSVGVLGPAWVCVCLCGDERRCRPGNRLCRFPFFEWMGSLARAHNGSYVTAAEARLQSAAVFGANLFMFGVGTKREGESV